MTLRSIIIDDEQQGIDALEILIEKFIPDVKVVAKTTNPSEAVGLIENYRPEIVFLDINMPELNGFQLLEKLATRNFNLVFTTAYHNFAINALKNNAIDYLLKPIDRNDLNLAITRVKAGIAAEEQERSAAALRQLLQELAGDNKNDKLLINTKTGVEWVDPAQILIMESSSNYTRIHLEKHQILTTKILKDFETQLCAGDTNFMRVHNSFIINLHQVVRLVKHSDIIVMSNEQKIPLAKSRRKVFLNWLQK